MISIDYILFKPSNSSHGIHTDGSSPFNKKDWVTYECPICNRERTCLFSSITASRSDTLLQWRDRWRDFSIFKQMTEGNDNKKQGGKKMILFHALYLQMKIAYKKGEHKRCVESNFTQTKLFKQVCMLTYSHSPTSFALQLSTPKSSFSLKQN